MSTNINLRNLLHILKNDWLKKNQPKEYQTALDQYYQTPLHDIIKETVEWFKPYKGQNIYYEISIYNLRTMALDQIKELEQQFNKAATGVFALEYDNAATLILSDGYGYLYKMLLTKNGDTYQFNLWDDTGSNSLLAFNTKNKQLSGEEIRQIEKVMSNYQRGIINCSDCGKEIEKHEIAGRYFAGRYCKVCWEGKWRAIEAKETYD